jgi:hypothetical protein
MLRTHATAPLCRQEEEVEDKNHKVKKITYYLESNEKDGNLRIDEFVQKALDLYRDQEAGKVDHAR